MLRRKCSVPVVSGKKCCLRSDMLYSRKDKIDKSYDVIVIGSGLAGLTAANKLAKNGRKVLLLEAHNKLGGLATWFRRKNGKHIFDVSLHGFPAGMIKTCKKYWNRDIASSITKLGKVRFVNPQFDVETEFTKEDYKRILKETFKVDESSVDNFFEYLGKMNFYDQNNMTNGELFEKFFPGRNDVMRFLLEPIVYANGSTLEDPAITYAIVFSNFMSKGVYTFKGGTDVLIGKMKDELLANGVDIKMHAKVEKISVVSGVVKGVYLDDQFIESKSVLSNANLLSTIFKMTGKENFNSEYLEKASKVRLNTSSCQVYMGIKDGETLPDVGDLIFHSEANEFTTQGLLDPKVTGQTFSIYYPDTRPHLENKYAIVSSSNARYEDWVNLSEDEYKDRKQHLIDRALEVIERLIPGVTEKIETVDAATPLTVQRYTHHERGASFGTKFEGLEVSQTMNQQVDGLFHSGSVGIIMSGWLGAANYGVIQSHEVDNYLDKQD